MAVEAAYAVQDFDIIAQGSNSTADYRENVTEQFRVDGPRLDFTHPSPDTQDHGFLGMDDADWLGGQSGWQPIYQRDPLANVRLDDTWGGLEFLWQN